MSNQYPSRYDIGESVVLKLQGCEIYCVVRAIVFSNMKVRYSLFVKDEETTLHNVDSYFVEDANEVNDIVDFGDDNYS